MNALGDRQNLPWKLGGILSSYAKMNSMVCVLRSRHLSSNEIYHIEL